MTLSGRQNFTIKTDGLWLVTLAILTEWKYNDRKAENERKDELREKKRKVTTELFIGQKK